MRITAFQAETRRLISTPPPAVVWVLGSVPVRNCVRKMPPQNKDHYRDYMLATVAIVFEMRSCPAFGKLARLTRSLTPTGPIPAPIGN